MTFLLEPIPGDVALWLAGLVGAVVVSAVGIAGKILLTVWTSKRESDALLFQHGPTMAVALVKSAEALDRQTKALSEFPALVREVTRGINRLDSMVIQVASFYRRPADEGQSGNNRRTDGGGD